MLKKLFTAATIFLTGTTIATAQSSCRMYTPDQASQILKESLGQDHTITLVDENTTDTSSNPENVVWKQIILRVYTGAESWTLVGFLPNGMACIVDQGTSYRVDEENGVAGFMSNSGSSLVVNLDENGWCLKEAGQECFATGVEWSIIPTGDDA